MPPSPPPPPETTTQEIIDYHDHHDDHGDYSNHGDTHRDVWMPDNGWASDTDVLKNIGGENSADRRYWKNLRVRSTATQQVFVPLIQLFN